MKRTFIIGLLMLAGGWAHAALYSNTFSPGTSIPAGDPVGTAFTGSFSSAASGPVLGLTVQLNVTGGYSGGFYMYLVGPDGTTTVTLLNTPGTSTSGVNITLQDGATTITPGSDLSSGTWAASGSLSGLNGQVVNGNWTLYFADLASGGGNPTLNSWTLNITAVPEPINYALAVFSLLFVGVGTRRFYLARRRSATAS